MVVGPSTAQYVGSNWTCAPTGECWYIWKWSEFVSASGLNYVDIVSYVRYLPSQWDCCYIDGLLNTVDANRGGKPTWLIESGFDGTPTDGVDKARNMVGSTIAFWNRGFTDKYFWYPFQTDETYSNPSNKGFIQTTTDSPSIGIEPDPLFHPVFRASEVMSLVLAGFGTADHPASVNAGAGARVYKFTSASREVWVVWSINTGSNVIISLDTGGKTTRVIGLFGDDLGTFSGGTITLTPLPTYLTTELAWNQNVGRITGRVRNSALPNQWNNGIVGAIVTITGPVNATAVTDTDGNFSFDYLPFGSYTVTVAGYSTMPGNQMIVIQRDAGWGRTSFVTK